MGCRLLELFPRDVDGVAIHEGYFANDSTLNLIAMSCKVSTGACRIRLVILVILPGQRRTERRAHTCALTQTKIAQCESRAFAATILHRTVPKSMASRFFNNFAFFFLT